MTHAHLLRLVSHLGLRQNSLAFAPVQLVKRTTRNERNQGPHQMGQATSFIRAYAFANGNDSQEEPKGRIDNEEASAQENEGKVVEQQVTEDVLAKADDAEKVLEAADVSMTNDLDKNIEKKLVSEPNQLADKKVAVVEEPVKSQTALNLALDELGEPPERPLPGDCCGQGCDVCVWDTYNDLLRDYLVRKKALLKQSK